MSALIINRLPKHRRDFDDWLHDIECPVYMIGPEVAVYEFEICNLVQGYDNYSDDETIINGAIELYKSHPFDIVVALEESDILRAGEIRSKLHVKGQGVDSAKAFRDKYIMKRILISDNIDVATFAKIDSNDRGALLNFCEEEGFPIVLKPRDGWTSNGIKVINSLNEANKVTLNNNYMVEKYIEGNMYHVDGFIHNGELKFICVSKYINNHLSYHSSAGVGSIILEATHYLYDSLYKETNKVLKSLPTPDTTSFHAEFFENNEKIILCEIASRTAGGRIPEIIEFIFGIDLDKIITRSQCELEYKIPKDSRYHHGKVAGRYFIPPKKGMLKKIPNKPDFEWLTKYEVNGETGKTYNGPMKTTDCYIFIIVEGDSHDEVKQKIIEIIEYVEENTEWK